MRFHRLFIILSLLLVKVTASAQDFVYQPQNPAFGGSYLNYSWMLSSAQAQNGFEDEEASRERFERDPLQDFEQSLNRQILGQITRQLFNDQFGEGGLQEGQYELGNYQIDVVPSSEGIQITILDTGTGGETTVSVPYF
ncbi:MAG: curli production assembly/transport component CsgF [Tunicatimonas sp.]|uniref:curli production assembly/transport component CsgF n=1 Tax=Tunicatimonas sp. TaxID=1940096 RepID=UPI003C72C177